ncbi:hypothetical protein F4860DRAFT_478085 [Xylaria cubensis]|nr:hypothetical protein F4860DRAFT_478085 [Xylaria cubensis]
MNLRQISHFDADLMSRFRGRKGSMKISPFAMALHLIHSPSWDEASETRLNDLLGNSHENLNASVPCTWPSSCFVASSSIAVEVEIRAGNKEAVALGNF